MLQSARLCGFIGRGCSVNIAVNFNIIGIAIALGALAAMSPSAFAQNGGAQNRGAQNGGVVISQVWGGGGNTGAAYKSDYVELFNRSPEPVSLDGWSVQYAAPVGAMWLKADLAGTIAGHGYYLIQMSDPGGAGALLPDPDAAGPNIGMLATDGKVALVQHANPLPAQQCLEQGSNGIVDFVGYGNAICFEGGGPAAATSTANAIYRLEDGCIDSNYNWEDFETGPPAARNTASPINERCIATMYGACCVGGSCFQLSQLDCEDAGGIYQGDATPCGSGMYEVQNVSAALEDISTNPDAAAITGLANDGSSAGLPLPFDFIYFGNPINAGSNFYINANGFVALGPNPGNGVNLAANAALPQGVQAPNSIIAAYWDNLIQTSTLGKVHWMAAGSAPGRRLIVQWTLMPHSTLGGSASALKSTFQILLHETSNIIEFRYGTVTANGRGSNPVASFNAGLESGSGLQGVNIDPAAIGAGGDAAAHQFIPIGSQGCEAADSDRDGVADDLDNCPDDFNPDQSDIDGDGLGDACDPDDDDDGVLDIEDNCPQSANADQANFDADALGDACDPDDDNDGVRMGKMAARLIR